MKKKASGLSAKQHTTSKASPRSKTIRFLRLRSTLMRVASVSGYQRDLSPRPASPSFTKPAPAAMMPPLCIRFLMMVRKAWFLVERGFPLSTARTFSEVTSKRVIFLDRSATSTSVPQKIVSHTAATSSSSSNKKTRSAKYSAATLRPAIAPPANGSTNTDGRCFEAISHCRSSGTSEVLASCERKGLKCRTWATLVGLAFPLSCFKSEVNASIFSGSTKLADTPHVPAQLSGLRPGPLGARFAYSDAAKPLNPLCSHKHVCCKSSGWRWIFLPGGAALDEAVQDREQLTQHSDQSFYGFSSGS